MTRRPSHLLAKSCSDPEHPAGQATLRGHTMLVCEAADRLLERRAVESLRTVGLPVAWVERLCSIVRLAAFAHDLGKCSNHFQEVVRGRRTVPQLVRHEAASLWLIWPEQPLSSWFTSKVNNSDLMIVAIAAAGHHRKFWQKAIAAESSGAGTQIELWLDHPGFLDLLEAGARRFELPTPPALAGTTLEVNRRSSLRRSFEAWEEQWSEHARANPQDAMLAAVAKALVLAADVAGSALAKADERLAWIAAQLDRRPTKEDLQSIVELRLGCHRPRPFQEAVATSAAPLTFVRAGCGSGKTIAAYMWAQQHAGRQLWVTYPTTGTSTEGYRDYVAGAVTELDLEARLEHSRRDVDLEIFDLSKDADSARARDRLDAIRVWGSQVVVCTVDTVLGLIQNQRKGMYAWPGLAHAAVVFDEVHAYDDELFGALLRFLEAMPGTPALLMTASLSSERMSVLCDLARRVHGQELAEVAGPAALEQLERYVRIRADPDAAVAECLASGGKVLWISNTVDRCIGVSQRFSEGLVYHSRFRYIDRVARHGEVVDAFRVPGPSLVSATQVAEMSLDLSADLLVTEVAPIPALIQRLGRLNRRSTPENRQPPKPFIVLPVKRAEPYETAQLDEAWQWLDALGAGPLTQADLARAWSSTGNQVPRTASAWLDGGFTTVPGPVRSPSIGITVLREEDADEVRANPSQAIAYAIPMNTPPKSLRWQGWTQVAHLPVAPKGALLYDPTKGASWA